MDENQEDLELDQEPAAQEYEGDDISALAAAKQRMAERDAEYSAKFNEAAEAANPTKKPAVKKAAAPARRVSSDVPAYAEDAPMVAKDEPDAVAEEKPVVAKKRNPEMTAPVVRDAEAKVRKVSNVKRDEVQGGLRSLRGSTQVPANSDKAEYEAAWKKMK